MKINSKTSLTPKQKVVLDFISGFTVKHGYSPSLQEIAENFRRSISTVQHYIEELQGKGYINKINNIARGITSAEETSKQIFKLGYIAAGKPIEPIENPEPIDIPSSFINSSGNYYALKVRGDSMIDENIQDGDTIIVKHQITAEDKDTVVAITEDGATLKRLRNENGKIYLEPRNKKLRNIYPESLEIRGKFVGLIRQD